MRSRSLALAALSSAVVLTLSPAYGQFVPHSLDNPATYIPDNTMSYLVHKQNPIVSRFGDEYTGWLDIRHPARVSVNSPSTTGYDMSDHMLKIRTTTLTDSAGTVAMPNIERDFNFANKVWNPQGGLSFIQDAHRAYTSGAAVPGGQPVTFTFPPEVGGSSAVFDGRIGSATNNLTGGPTSQRVDMYYVGNMDSVADSVFRGYMYFSAVNTLASQGHTTAGSFRPFGVVATTGDDTGVADTFAHEIGHFILNGPSVDAPGTGGHSTTKTNLMASGSIRWYPGQAMNDVTPNGPPSNIPLTVSVVGKTMILNADGTPRVGGIDQLTAGTSATSQIRRIFDSTNNATSTNYLALNRNAGAGDRIDFDFVADSGRMDGNVAALDNNNLDGVAGADNFPGPTGERLFFGKGTAVASDQTGKNKTGMGTFPALNDFNGASFKFADIFSLNARYADSDIDENGVLSLRENCLDFNVQFRDDSGAVSNGTPVFLWNGGWSPDTVSDNWVSRWVPSDPNFVATGLFVIALDGTFNGAKYDGVTQIDGVMVGVPEPASVALLSIGLLALRRRR